MLQVSRVIAAVPARLHKGRARLALKRTGCTRHNCGGATRPTGVILGFVMAFLVAPPGPLLAQRHSTGRSRPALARCRTPLPTSSDSSGCALLIRYSRAELDGWFWPGGAGDHDSLPDSARALRVPRGAYHWLTAKVVTDPEFCAAARVGDTLSLSVEFGELGEMAIDEEGYGIRFSRPYRYRNGQPVDLHPPYLWVLKDYRAVWSGHEWRVAYPPGSENGPEPVVGLAAAERVYQTGASARYAAEFRRQMAQAAAGLRRLTRPRCPAAPAGAQNPRAGGD